MYITQRVTQLNLPPPLGRTALPLLDAVLKTKEEYIMQKRAARRGMRALAFLLCLLMVVSLLPVMGASAAESNMVNSEARDDADLSSNGLVLDKNLYLQSDGTYTLKLEAYATGTTTTVTEKSGTPLDIVLVLDQSGSMKSNDYVEPLRNAVTKFVESISKNATEYNVDHRIALVGYASRYDSSSKWANTGLFIDGELYNYQKAGSNTETSRLTANDYKKALVSVNDENGDVASSITSAIKAINGNGATYTNYGMEMANGVFQNNPIENGSDRKRIVVVFTDGQPGRSGYDEAIANLALKEAYQTKNTYGATVYTVGLYSDANTNVTNFMNYLSSNYPDAQSMSVTTSYAYNPVYSSNLDTSKTYYVDYSGNYYEVTYSQRDSKWHTYWNGSYTPTTSSSDTNYSHTQFYEKTALESTGGSGTQAANKYYMTTSNSAELEKIFSNITADIQNPTSNVKLNAEAVLKDVISDNFTITSGTSVTVSTEKGSQASADADIVFNGSGTSNPTAALMDNTITVTGFDYSNQYIAPSHEGEKLIVVIDKLLPNTDATTHVYSNGEAGIYESSNATDPVATFQKPYINIAEVTKVLDFSMTANIASNVLNTNRFTSNYGTFTNSDNTLTYKLNGTVESGNLVFDGIDSALYYGHAYGDDTAPNAWTKVNVIPANNVYYDDDLLDVKSDFNDDDYGYDVNVPDTTETQNVGDGIVSSTPAKTFKFKGTGIDVYCTTEANSGTVIAQLRKVNEDGSLSRVDGVQDIVMNNTYNSGVLYNVPTIFFKDLPYDTYQLSIFTGTNLNYQLDGVRIYNPGSAEVKELYSEDEQNATFLKVRDLLIDANSFDSGVENVSGAVYTDSIKDGATVAQYVDIGPKNEVYLAKGNAIAFKVDDYRNGMKVMVGLSAPEAGNGAVKLSDDASATEKEINSTVDMYYKVTPNADGYVVIENTGDSLISVTKVKVSGTTAGTAATLSVDDGLLTYMASFNSLEVTEPDAGPDPTPDTTPNQTTITATINAIWNRVMNGIAKLFGRL